MTLIVEQVVAPAWGSPSPLLPFTVVGFYALNGERFIGHVLAEHPRIAEDAAQERWGNICNEFGDCVDLKVCAVFDGHLDAADDGYATYLDPDER
jgi:hypothetical protein